MLLFGFYLTLNIDSLNIVTEWPQWNENKVKPENEKKNKTKQKCFGLFIFFFLCKKVRCFGWKEQKVQENLFEGLPYLQCKQSKWFLEQSLYFIINSSRDYGEYSNKVRACMWWSVHRYWIRHRNKIESFRESLPKRSNGRFTVYRLFNFFIKGLGFLK